MALDSLASTLKLLINWTAQKNVTGTDYTATANVSQIQKTLTLGTAAANAAAGGSDELISKIYSIGASSNTSIDLTSLTDILAQTSVSLARVKAIVIRLLSASDDSTNGTAASSITIDNTVTNALSAQSNTGWFNNAHEGTATGGAGDATGSKFTIPSGGWMGFGVANAGGVLVDGTHKVIKIVNNDAGLAAAVQVTLVGGST